MIVSFCFMSRTGFEGFSKIPSERRDSMDFLELHIEMGWLTPDGGTRLERCFVRFVNVFENFQWLSGCVSMSLKL